MVIFASFEDLPDVGKGADARWHAAVVGGRRSVPP
jgi:hypothetical protein